MDKWEILFGIEHMNLIFTSHKILYYNWLYSYIKFIMKAKLCKILRSKTLNGESTDNESGRKIKLRTIFKGRGQSSLDASQVK